MEKIWAELAERDISLDSGARLAGQVEMAYLKTRPHYSDVLVDEYGPVITGLDIVLADGTRAAIAGSSELYAELARELPDLITLPLSTMLVAKGEPAPQHQASFEHTLSDIHVIEETGQVILESLIDEDDTRFDDARWRRFQITPQFRRAPCTREEYMALSAERTESKYMTMPMCEYYGWYQNSSEMTDQSGSLNLKTLAKVSYMLEAWNQPRPDTGLPMTQSQQKYFLARNLQVHPRHKHLFDAVVDQAMPEAASDIPGPGQS